MMKRLSHYQSQVNDAANDLLQQELGENQLTLACRYAINGGKRLRPAMTLSICESLNASVSAVSAACAVEFLHTASLVIDDLPCMDNDMTRRGKPSVHVCYGEAIAQLVAVSLVSAAFRLLLQNVDMVEYAYDRNRCNSMGMEIMKRVSLNMGGLGAAGGQLMDMAMMEKLRDSNASLGQMAKIAVNKDSVVDAIHRKTSTFFEVAMLVGWILGGGDLEKLDQIGELAKNFGLAYQIADDMEDVRQDFENSGKNSSMNYVLQFGVETAVSHFKANVFAFTEGAKKYGIWSQTLLESVNLMIRKMNETKSSATVFIQRHSFLQIE